MADLKKRLLEFIKEEKLFSSGDPVLLAVSGGIDSMVMLHLFHDCRLKFGVAHVNFQLRGKESDDDESFVKAAAENFKAKFYSNHFNTKEYANDKKISLQMAARELRYEWLEKVRKENGYHRIVVAHHLDDSIETALINMFRGTGIHGLKGIAAMNDKIVRPLLCFYKEELKHYAEQNNISYREDSSNLTVDYDRNKIRLEIIPAIEKHFSAFHKTFSENISKWKDAALIYDQTFKKIKKQFIEQRGDEFWISIPKLKLNQAYKTILFELLSEYGFNSDQVSQIADSFESESGKIFLSASHRIIKDRKHLIISAVSTTSVSEMLIHETDEQINAGKLFLKISDRTPKEFSIPKDSSVSCLDKKELEFPLVLRKWKKGDYFYPLGMKNLPAGRQGKKKISNYLVDRKIPLPEKENIWVIESNRRIACIIGERIDERFKVTSSTETIYVVEKK